MTDGQDKPNARASVKLLGGRPTSKLTSNPVYKVRPANWRLRRLPYRRPASANSLLTRALDYLYPWEVAAYPGRDRGAMLVLQGRVTIHAIRKWRTGKRPMPEWLAVELADMIGARGRRALEIERELRDYRKPVPTNRSGAKLGSGKDYSARERGPFDRTD